jgi:hypothetical protein
MVLATSGTLGAAGSHKFTILSPLGGYPDPAPGAVDNGCNQSGRCVLGWVNAAKVWHIPPHGLPRERKPSLRIPLYSQPSTASRTHYREAYQTYPCSCRTGADSRRLACRSRVMRAPSRGMSQPHILVRWCSASSSCSTSSAIGAAFAGEYRLDRLIERYSFILNPWKLDQAPACDGAASSSPRIL